MLDRIDILVKTALGMEDVTATRIEEVVPSSHVIPKPYGFMGLVAIKVDGEKRKIAELIKREVLEADRVIIVDECVEAELNKIAEAAAKVSKEKIGREETFAIRTVRRGKHNFTSIDVNIVAGAAVKEATEAIVDLKYPNKIVRIEILKDIALIAVESGSEELKKLRPGKKSVVEYLRKIAVIQMPYLGPLDAVKVMGIRIGREVQTFEVKELVIAPIGAVKAEELKTFIDGVFEGIKSRYEIQKRSYGRKVWKVPVYIQDLHQLVRERFRKEPIIVLEPEGEPLPKIKSELASILLGKYRRINVLIGAREGIPLGLYRFANLVIDICPGVTISTDYAAASALIAFSTIIEEKLLETKEN